MDVCKCTFMNSKEFEFLSNNLPALRASVVPEGVRESDWNLGKSERAYKKVPFVDCFSLIFEFLLGFGAQFVLLRLVRKFRLFLSCDLRF